MHTGAHHRLAHAGHDGADVGEVEIDQTFLDHQIGDAGHAGAQHIVGHGEGVSEGGLLVGDAEQILIGNDQQSVDIFLQLVDADFGGAQAPRALELEWLGDDADGEDALLSRGARDHRGCARAGTAAHAGGDEHHVAADEMGLDVGHCLFGRGSTDFRLRASAETLGHVGSHLNAALAVRARQRLRVGVGDDELDALETAFDHVVDGIAAGTADTEYGDARFEFGQIWNSEVDGHGGHPILSELPLLRLPRRVPVKRYGTFRPLEVISDPFANPGEVPGTRTQEPLLCTS
jgi:hypothetical protein